MKRSKKTDRRGGKQEKNQRVKIRRKREKNKKIN